MKKVLFLALAAAAVMSCSESEEIENAGQKAEIKLGTVVGNTTRATVTDLPELQKVGFTVYAYNTGATTMASVATFDAMKEFMAAVKVTYSAPDWSLTVTNGMEANFSKSSAISLCLASTVSDAGRIQYFIVRSCSLPASFLE